MLPCGQQSQVRRVSAGEQVDLQARNEVCHGLELSLREEGPGLSEVKDRSNESCIALGLWVTFMTGGTS